VAWEALYSFWFAESHKLFEKAVAKDPDCAIAFWGEAMSGYEQIGGGSLPEGEQLADGQRAIAGWFWNEQSPCKSEKTRPLACTDVVPDR
jgi:hypothetical protein